MFTAGFAALTLVALSSEAVLFGYLKFYPQHEIAALALAAPCNTLGCMTTYLLGRLLPERTRSRLEPRVLRWLRRHGAPATFFAGCRWWETASRCAPAGCAHWPAALAYIAAARLVRYAVTAQGAIGF